MKRDVDLTRAILLFIEEHSPPQGGLDKHLEIEGYDRPTVFAHAGLLIDDGLIDGQVIETLAGIHQVIVMRLTSAGHEAIEQARNNSGWNKAKDLAVRKGIPMTFAAVLEIAKEITKAELRKLLGGPL